MPNNKNSNQKGSNPEKSGNITKNIVYIIILILIGLSIYSFTNPGSKNEEDSSISEITKEVQTGNVENITVENNKVIAKLKDSSTKLITYKESGVGLNEYGLTPDKVKIEIKNPDSGTAWSTILSIFIPFAIIALFLWFLFRQTQGANIKALSFGKSSARIYMGKNKTVFSDVAGLKEAKNELVEVVDFLRNPKKYLDLGAEIPKGILMIGPPGTGKTLLAKAVAGEAGVPFLSISASEFVEMFVGVGASRVRDLFTKAKRNAPALIFIDELDAIGRQRGTGLGGSHDEREQTLNQILVEMDGFETDTRVIIIAATNRPDVLDPALLRPGRFDRRVMLGLPDKRERVQIFRIHSRKKPIEANVDFERLASSTAGVAGADIRNIINEAAILAAGKNRKTITQEDIHKSIEKVLMGPEKKSRVLSSHEKKIAATHEAGHALVGHLLPQCDPIHKVSVISRGLALGYTWSMPKDDRHLYSKSKFCDDIAQLLAGRSAEKIILGETTTGAENDLKRATKIARDMVTVYGMSDKIGPQALGEREELVFLGKELGEHKNYSEKIASIIDDEVTKIISEAQDKAHQILSKNKALLLKITDELIKKEVIEQDEFEKFFPKKKT